MSRSTHAVVLGAGMAGVLAAAALAEVADVITVVERDQLPAEPAHRTGLPQARHAHMLWSGGARAVDRLLPGTTTRLLAGGAHRIGVPASFVALTAHGWLPRRTESQYTIACTRDLLDWTLRDRAQQDRRITFRDRTVAVGLTGDASRVTGVRVDNRAAGIVEQLDADIVVDATGRGSGAQGWLSALGVPGVGSVREAVIDSGVTYVTRVFQAPAEAARDFPLVSVQFDVPTRGPGVAATLMPVEDGRWLVTLAGTRGHAPPRDEAGFLDFARNTVRHPIVADLIAGCRPLTPIYVSHSTANRRVYFEQLSQWPDGLVVLADALATYNPIYGHGMSVAAYNCLAMQAQIQSHGLGPGSGRSLQRVVARSGQAAWDMATSVDLFYPDAAASPPSRADRARLQYMNRVIRAATTQDAVAEAFFDAISLSAPPTRLIAPRVLLAAARPRPDPSPEAAARAPLTGEELGRAFSNRPAPRSE
jgi:flavin-dependent dehydrogenase